MTTPTGPLTLPLIAVRTAVTGTAAFLAWVGPSVPVASRAYLIDEPADGGGDKFAVIDWGFDCNRTATDVSAPANFQQDGSILVAYRWAIPPGTSDDEATVQFLNFLGDQLPQFERALRAAGIAILSNNLIAGPQRPDFEDRKRRDLYEAIFHVTARDWPA